MTEPEDDGAMLLTLDAAAKRLAVSTSTLRRHIAAGELRTVRISNRVLIAPEQLRDYVQRLVDEDAARVALERARLRRRRAG